MPEVIKEFDVDCSVEDTWDFFNTPEEIAACVPGCESVEQLDEDTFEALVAVKVAYTNLTFDTIIEITDREELSAMSVEGTAEPSGRMPGSAQVTGNLNLAAQDDGTTGEMTIQFAIRGRLGSLGESAFTRKCDEMTERFIENVQAELEGVEAA